MAEIVYEILMFCGACFILIVLYAIGIGLYYAICEFIEKKKYEYRYKHRFDKPPTAKCYCRDCVHHGDEQNACYKFEGWHTADNWFCWDAQPREAKLEKKEDNTDIYI